jgi:hypothetical protein
VTVTIEKMTMASSETLSKRSLRGFGFVGSGSMVQGSRKFESLHIIIEVEISSDGNGQQSRAERLLGDYGFC